MDAHKPMEEILSVMDRQTINNVLSFPGVLEFIKKAAPTSALKDRVLSLAQ
jgi:hypothetical protein